MAGTDWRPVNRYSSNAKKHAPKTHDRSAKETGKDLDTTVQEIFTEWKNSKGGN